MKIYVCDTCIYRHNWNYVMIKICSYCELYYLIPVPILIQKIPISITFKNIQPLNQLREMIWLVDVDSHTDPTGGSKYRFSVLGASHPGLDKNLH